MLTHRMMSLFYRAWASGQPAPNFDRRDDPLSARVASFSGYHGTHLRDRDEMPDLARLHFAGDSVGGGRKNPEGLISILTTFFKVPVRGAGIRRQLAGTGAGRPVAAGRPGGGWGRRRASALRSGPAPTKFRLQIGPLSLADYERLLPGGGSLERLRAIVRNYVGDILDWDVNLILKGDEVPRASLGGTTRLGPQPAGQ